MAAVPPASLRLAQGVRTTLGLCVFRHLTWTIYKHYTLSRIGPRKNLTQLLTLSLVLRILRSGVKTMARHRSPNCPQITFLEAATKAREVYNKEHRSIADKAVIAEDLGYKSLNGASLSLLGALRQYGLLESAGEGLRISDSAVDYFELPEESTERKKAQLRLAFKPALLRELEKQFGATVSDANLRHALIKRGFLPDAADEVIRVYRENMKLVGEDDLEYNQDEDDEDMPSLVEVKTPQQQQKTEEAKPQSDLRPRALLSQTLAISIPRNLNVDIAIRGDEVRREDVAKIKNQFNRWIEGLEEAFE